ncbi:hypothetical protein SAMN05421663_105298 [Terribacillus halophilus]|uniref:Uncharacterized protein n=1 Tax=Terribacillus halophilus TaxID=361279 RepID=A0A1G6R1B8_9BACI|nr:hypothetical protein [Terribacillus halophilus]SDC98024.1 hypothetical protein SAMN05421663_105298 [Terribacillus halophilus]
MIKSKKMLWTSLVLFIVTTAMTIPFPHKNPLGETVVAMFQFPIRTVHGLHYMGITALILFIASLFFLTRSLEKYHVRAVLLAIVIAVFLPSMIVEFYQKTLATGVDAVYYDEEWSNCDFEMVDGSTLSGECELPFENYSSDDVEFSVEFYEKYDFEDDTPMVSLLNDKAPHKVSLMGKERKLVKIKTRIDVSEMENHIEGGSASGVNIIIKSGEKMRKL